MDAKEQHSRNSPSTSSLTSSLVPARRASVASISLQLNTDRLNQAFDDAHAKASRSDHLTSFSDFAPPPKAPSEGNDGPLSATSSGLGNLYHRLKASVGPQQPREVASTSKAQSSENLDLTARQASGVNDHVEKEPKQDAVEAKMTVTKPTSELDREAIQKGTKSLNDSQQTPSGRSTPRSQRSVERSRDNKAPTPRSFSRIASPSPSVPETVQTGDRRGRSSTIDQPLQDTSTSQSTLRQPMQEQKQNNAFADPTSVPSLQREFSAADPKISRSNSETRSELHSADEGSPADRQEITQPWMPVGKYEARLNLPLPSITSSTATNTPSERSVAAPNFARVATSARNVGPSTRSDQYPAPNGLIYQMQRKVLNRDFWMKDENAKVCFSCGDSFTTFRRKHHCRLCGQIYCNACTKQISGRPFGQSSKLRICNSCDTMLRDDESSDDSDADHTPSTPQVRQIRFSDTPIRPSDSANASGREKHSTIYKHPALANSNTSLRRSRDGKRPTTPGSIHERGPTLARPSSIRSLKSQSGRPKSANFRTRRPRSQHMRSLSIGPEEAVALWRTAETNLATDHKFSSFQSDSIVDPDLEPFLSDEASSDDDAPNIGSILTKDNLDSQNNRVPMLNVARKGRPRSAPRTNLESQIGFDDAASITSSRAGPFRRHIPGRTMSTGSFDNLGFPRLGLSDNLMKSSDNLYAMLGRLGRLTHSDQQDPLLDFMDRSKRYDDGDPRIEMQSASLSHLSALLKQFATDVKIENSKRWDKALIPVLCQCAASVQPNYHRGDDMDIRHYVKVKKIPAGSPADTAYVSGFVFTNNTALRDMPRVLNRPRVLLVSFSLIYARHQQHFMSLEGVIAQEQEYLANLSTRIKSLEPDLLLVQGDVAGQVKKTLHKLQVTIIHNVKASVMHAVSRFTQTHIVSSVDKLNMHPNQLGHCGRFEVKTFVHQTQKKSYVFISGCQRDLGCTIVLRGADVKTLRKLKWIAEFMCYAAFNLRLEACLMRDQFASIPLRADAPSRPAAKEAENMSDLQTGSYGDKLKNLNDRILSASSVVRLPDPYLLSNARDKEIEMRRIRQLQQYEVPEIPENGDISSQAIPQKFELVRPEMMYDTTAGASEQVREILRAIYSAQYDRLSHSYESIKRRWDTYTAGVVDAFSPVAHQRIVILFSSVSNATGDACEGPDVLAIDFYQTRDLEDEAEGDMPLGEYIERLCNQAQSPCTAGRCEYKMIDHDRQYVHGDGQVSIHVEDFSPQFEGMENVILMWSVCKLCSYETQIAPMSAESWKYSFAMYLELTFWAQPIKPRASTCSHDIQKDHVRCFGFRNLAVKVRYDPINTVDVIFPRPMVTWIVEKDLHLKNDVYLRIVERIGRYVASVKARLKSINLDTINLEKRERCKDEVHALLKRVNDQYDALLKQLQERYMTSRYYETLPLNRAVRALQEHVAQWDTTFAEFEVSYFPSERDLRKLAAIQFRKTFLEKEEPIVPAQDDVAAGSEEKAASSLAESETNEKSRTESGGGDQALERKQSGPVEEERLVQTLDLAVPNAGGTSPPPAEEVAPPMAPGANASNERALVYEPSPLDATIVSKIDSMQHEEGNQSPDTANISPPPGRPTKTPPLFRSQTQPASPEVVKSVGSADVAVRPRVLDSIVKHNERTTADGKTDEGSAFTGAKSIQAAVRSMIPRPVASRRNETRVSELAKHFEQISREFEKEKIRERRLRAARTRQSRAFPMASANPILEVFRDASEAVRERETVSKTQREDNQAQVTTKAAGKGDTSPSVTKGLQAAAETDVDGRKGHDRDRSFEESYPGSGAEDAINDEETPAAADPQALEEPPEPREYPQEMAKEEKSTFYQMLASLWSERSASGWGNLEYPLGPDEHVFGDSDVIAREEEPSSLIAFALALHDYNTKIQRFRDRAKVPASNSEARTQPSATLKDEGIEDVLLGKTATHLRYQFESGSTRMQCKIFFSESFDAIRRKCGVADRFVESLSSCMRWESKGGKTKSLFLKTHDDRFVIKSLSQIEAQSFLKFAPDYFDFMSKTLFHNLPSVLAKMLGVYQVSLKNSVTGFEYTWYLQVMENVFYEGPSNKMFDLKGSMRNRKVKSTGEKDEVLLDENLLDYISQSPIYVRYHSSAALTASITNDTLFCSKQNVMDYSLIVGLYEERKELMVGIIDWLRTYTWDKKLESWIKDRGKHKATVRSPKEYRQRFRRSIPRYFPLAPSCWQVFGVPRIGYGQQQFGEETESGEEDVAEAVQNFAVASNEGIEGQSLQAS